MGRTPRRPRAAAWWRRDAPHVDASRLPLARRCRGARPRKALRARCCLAQVTAGPHPGETDSAVQASRCPVGQSSSEAVASDRLCDRDPGDTLQKFVAGGEYSDQDAFQVSLYRYGPEVYPVVQLTPRPPVLLVLKLMNELVPVILRDLKLRECSGPVVLVDAFHAGSPSEEIPSSESTAESERAQDF
jgi:hypothetical protein